MTIFEAQSVPKEIIDFAERRLEGELGGERWAQRQLEKLRFIEAEMVRLHSGSRKYQQWERKAERLREELRGTVYERG